MTGDLPTKKYVLDTNTLIDFALWNPIHLNKIFWEKLESSLAEGKWIFLDVVFKEITRSGALKDWCKKQRANGLVTNINDADRSKAIEINNTYPMIDQSTFNSEGDTFILAYVQNNKIALFTRERNKKLDEVLHKIPDVCDSLGIEYTRLPEDFLNSIGFKN